MDKNILFIILSLFSFACSTFRPIPATSAYESDFHRVVLSIIDSTGSNTARHVVLYERPLLSELSLLIIVQDTTKPNIISIMISAKDSSSIDQVSIIDSAGYAIKFSSSLHLRYKQPIQDHRIVAVADLTWDKFVEICRLDSILMETGYRTLYLGKYAMSDFNILRQYLAERDPNEQPAENPTDDKVDPVVIKKVDPDYPSDALQAGMEGNVIVKAWVNKKGYVHKVVVLQSDAEIFCNPAIEAAQKWVFTPAKILGRPLSVWVSIPFRFRLTGKR